MDSLDEKRKKASQDNGKLGGVATSSGKAVASQNSTKYAIHSNKPFKLDLTPFEELYSAYAAKYDDTDVTRRALIEQAVYLDLRIKRCYRFEAEFLMQALDPPKYEKQVNENYFDLVQDEEPYKNVLIHEGSPMTIPIEKLMQLSELYTKVEGSLTARYLKIIKFLSQSAI